MASNVITETGDSIEDEVNKLENQITLLQSEKKKIEDEFGVQRAKMKDLFLQKETEFKQALADEKNKHQEEVRKLNTLLDECRSQLTISSLEFQSQLEAEKRKYQEELSSLQHLLNETIEESSKYINEIKRLNYCNWKLSTELNDHKSGSDMPQLLSVSGGMISSLARKVTNNITSLGNSDNNTGSGSGSPTVCSAPLSLSQFNDSDSLDESMRKAQEDAVVLRSLVVPLEDEIKALKEKIREMDSELRKYQNSDKISDEISKLPLSLVQNSDPSANQSSTENQSLSVVACEMCSSSEAQLLNAKQEIHNLEKHIVSLERYKHEWSNEAALRKDMEDKWNEKKEEYKEQVKSLQSKTDKAEEALKDLRATYSSTYDGITQQLQLLLNDRRKNFAYTNKLQKENDSLIGKYNRHSQQLQNEEINLPNTVPELQEVILRIQEELIVAKVAEETANEKVAMLRNEAAVIKEESTMQEQARKELENSLIGNMNKLRNDPLLVESRTSSESSDRSEHEPGDIRRELKQFSSDLDKLIKSKKFLEDTINELRSRISSLQTELDNSEKVQKDFVLLSQSLQQELEKIRAAEDEVRWEHEDDVTECRRCKQPFAVSKRKLNCRHCGRIYCQTCLTKVVNSGPNSRPSKVCDVCHTLLVRESAPYFSKAPPQAD